MSRLRAVVSAVRRRRGGALALVAAAASSVALAVPAHAALTNVSSADDVCSPTADPCVITQTVETAPAALLDFGGRALRIENGGSIDAGPYSLTILCGSFYMSVSGTGLTLRGPIGDNESEGGTGTIEVRGRCSGNANVLCFANAECMAQGAGTCTGGGGTATLDGKVFASADDPGYLVVRAAGDIHVTQTITSNATYMDNDGGGITLESTLGSVIVDAKLQAESGVLGTGGEVCLLAGQDIILNQPIDVKGGDFDGGTVDIEADGDVKIFDEILADAVTGEGYGGEICVLAGGNLTVSGGGASNRMLLSTQGNSGTEGFGGDGGPQEYDADGNVLFTTYVKPRANGASPDGYGETISISAGGDLVLQCQVESKALGGFGGGGVLELDADGLLDVQSSAAVTLTGTDGGGGELSLSSFGDISFAGSADLSPGSTALAGVAELDADRNVTISGSITNRGTERFGSVGEYDILGCRVDVLSGAELSNLAAASRNVFSIGERMSTASGSEVLADPSLGTNLIRYRDPAKPPTLAGTMSPAATLMVVPTLFACPECGNGDVDGGETCDDGNTVGGDGCSADCQLEGCIADTPGYPSVALCDDGIDCTVDSCDRATAHCIHFTDCDDGVDCTVDSCVGESCVFVPDDSLCDDGDECTDGLCNAVTGCSAVANTAPCDDGTFCNGTDTCAAGSCSVHSGDPCTGGVECAESCNETSRACLSPPGTPCSSDDKDCTDDVCNLLGVCVHPFNNAFCDDGIFCNGIDICNLGSCSVHAGDPCTGGAECMDTCNETDDVCLSPAGDACTDDGDVCTDDICDGEGGCSHPFNTAPCDDGDFCTLADHCSGGVCVANDYDPLVAGSVTATFNSGPADDRLVVKGQFPLALLTADPTVTGLQAVVRNAGNDPAYATTLPAADFINVRGKGRTFRFKNSDGSILPANGTRQAVVKRVIGKGLVKIKIKVKDVEVPLIAGQPDVSISALFGTSATTDECVSGRALTCADRGKKKRVCELSP